MLVFKTNYKKYLYLSILIVFSILVIFAILFFANQYGFKNNSSTATEGNISNGLQDIEPKPFPLETRARETPFENAPIFRFAVIGDTQHFNENNRYGALQMAVENIQKHDIDFVVSVGDIVHTCDGEEACFVALTHWKNILGDLFPKTYVVMGNHDRTGKKKADKLWKEFFEMPENAHYEMAEFTFSFDYEYAHFVFLNTERPKRHKIDKMQREWLKKDLMQNNKFHTFLFYHEPAFPVSRKIGDSLDVKEEERDEFWKIVDFYDVSATFSGHEHIHYRRKIDSSVFPEAQKEIYHFTIGTTDARLYEPPLPGSTEYYYVGKHFAIVTIKGIDIEVDIYTVEGKLLDRFSFRK